MLSLSRGGRCLAAIGLTAALSCSALAASAGASASTATARVPMSAAPDFKSPEECNGDVCMFLVVNGSPTAHAFIIAGANSNTFFGYFHISGPGGPFSPANSATETWPAHGLGSGNHSWHSMPLSPLHGTYCATAIIANSIGKACATY